MYRNFDAYHPYDPYHPYLREELNVLKTGVIDGVMQKVKGGSLKKRAIYRKTS